VKISGVTLFMIIVKKKRKPQPKKKSPKGISGRKYIVHPL
jgi:hypothetical protein